MADSPDPISAELERALFKRFWAWLAIVGSLVVAAVTAVSVLVAQVLLLTATSASEHKAQSELDQLSNKINLIDQSSVETAEKAAVNQEKSEASAVEAAEAVTRIKEQLKSVPEVAAIAKNINDAAASLGDKPDFQNAVANHLQLQWLTGPKTEVKIIANGVYEVNGTCPSGSLIVGYYCEVRSGSGKLQSIGLQSNKNFSCQWIDTQPWQNGNFSAWGNAVCIALKPASKS